MHVIIIIYIFRSEISADYSTAIDFWKRAKRISLSEFLSVGDARKMLLWRLFLQTAYDSSYGLLNRGNKCSLIYECNVVFECIASFFAEISIISEMEQLLFKFPAICSNICLTLWCVHIIGSLDQNIIGSELFSNSIKFLLSDMCISFSSVEVIVRSFQKMLGCLSIINVPGLADLIILYLKKICFSESLMSVSVALMNISIYTSTISHVRILFLISWILEDNSSHRLEINKETFVYSRNSIPDDEIDSISSHIIFQVRDSIRRISNDSIQPVLRSLRLSIEAVAQQLISLHTQYSLNKHIISVPTSPQVFLPNVLLYYSCLFFESFRVDIFTIQLL
jgi:hypothetical protein